MKGFRIRKERCPVKLPYMRSFGKINKANAKEILDTIIEVLERFREGHEREDDVTLIIINIINEPNL